MKVWKNKNMPEWNPENGTHYQQRITLGEKEQCKIYLVINLKDKKMDISI